MVHYDSTDDKTVSTDFMKGICIEKDVSKHVTHNTDSDSFTSVNLTMLRLIKSGNKSNKSN